jgi:hypothetical protein
MKKIITKKDIRNQIDQQIEDYLRQGGEVAQIERGISGRENANGPIEHRTNFSDKKPEQRTFVPEVVAALEARKKPAEKPAPAKKLKRPKKRLIYDDFGEPLRWEWVDE